MRLIAVHKLKVKLLGWLSVKKNEQTSEFEEDFGWVVGNWVSGYALLRMYGDGQIHNDTHARKDTKQKSSIKATNTQQVKH